MAEKLYHSAKEMSKLTGEEYTMNRDELQLVLEALEYMADQLWSAGLSDHARVPCLDRFIEEKRAAIASLRSRLADEDLEDKLTRAFGPRRG